MDTGTPCCAARDVSVVAASFRFVNFQIPSVWLARPCAALGPRAVRAWLKLQALVYDILPSTTAVFSYEQFFVDAQTVVRLLQATQIMSHICFITDRVAYASSNKTRIV